MKRLRLPIPDPRSNRLSRLAVDKQPTTSNVLVGLSRQLLPSTLLETTKDELRLERPLQGNVPDLAGLLIGKGVVVLQVGAEAFGFEGGPGGELVHGGGVLRPVWELVGVLGELGLEVLDGGGVLVEEDLRGEVLARWCLWLHGWAA